MTRWPTRKLGTLGTTYFKGISPKEKDLVGDTILIPSGAVFPSGIKLERTKRFAASRVGGIESRFLRTGDILFNCGGVGTLGRSGLFDEATFNANAVADSFVLAIRTNDFELLSRFLFYFLQSSQAEQQIEENTRGTTGITSIRTEAILGFELPVPPLAEQQRIVGVLDDSFASLAVAEANATKNVQNVRALLESYLETIFSHRGEGWVERPLGDVCEVKDGTHDSPKYVALGIPFVTQKNIREDGLSFEKTKFISQVDHDSYYRRSNVARGDILISMIGANRGMACLVDDTRVFSIKNVGLVKRNAAVNQAYLLHFLKSPQAANYVRAASKGGAQEFVGLTELRRWPVPLPPLETQNALAFQLDALEAEIQGLTQLYAQKQAALVALKKSLLHEAFSGTYERS
jgi:type I restriction enzyme S subunit